MKFRLNVSEAFLLYRPITDITFCLLNIWLEGIKDRSGDWSLDAAISYEMDQKMSLTARHFSQLQLHESKGLTQ